MPAYVVFIREKTLDPAQMQQYAQEAPKARAGHDITRLAFYEQHEVLEGPPAEGVAILCFPDMAAARAWYASPAYQHARQHRLQGAQYRMLLVDGSEAASQPSVKESVVKHVLFIVTNTHEIGPHKRPTGYFFPEIAHPVEVFERHGIAVEYCSPLGGAPSDDGYDESDPSQVAYRNGKSIRRLARSRRLSEVDVLDYDAVFVPGGLGPMADLATHPDVKLALARAWDAGLIVSAVCHGPCALLGVKTADGTPLVAGRQLTGFSNREEEGYAKDDVPFMLEDALVVEGARFSAADPWQARVVVDGRLMTGQNPASAGPLAEAIVKALR